MTALKASRLAIQVGEDMWCRSGDFDVLLLGLIR